MRGKGSFIIGTIVGRPFRLEVTWGVRDGGTNRRRRTKSRGGGRRRRLGYNSGPGVKV